MKIENTSYNNILADNKLDIEYTTMPKSGQKFDDEFIRNILIAKHLEEIENNSNGLQTNTQ